MSELSSSMHAQWLARLTGVAATVALLAACQPMEPNTPIRPEYDACTRTQPPSNEPGYPEVRNPQACADLMAGGFRWLAVNFTGEDISDSIVVTVDAFGRATRGNASVAIDTIDATEAAQQELSEQLGGAECIGTLDGIGTRAVRSTMQEELRQQQATRLIVILSQKYCDSDGRNGPDNGGVSRGNDIEIYDGTQFKNGLARVMLHELFHPEGDGHGGSATRFPIGQLLWPRDEKLVLSAEDLENAVWAPYNGGFDDPMGANLDVNSLQSAKLNPVMLDQTLWPLVEIGQRQPLANVAEVGESAVIDREAANNGSFVMSFIPQPSTVHGADGSMTFDRVALVPDLENREITVLMFGVVDYVVQTASRGIVNDATKELNVNGAVFDIVWGENEVTITRRDNA